MTRPAAQAASHDEALERAQRGTRQFLLARGCVMASGFVVTVILTRKLGPTDYGIFGVIMSQLLWLEMLTHAGVPGAIAKLMADGRHDHGEIERSGRALLLGFSVLLLGVCWFVAPQLANVMRIPNGEVLLRIAIMDLPFAAVFASYDGTLNGRRQFGVLAAAHLIYGMTKLAGVVALTSLGLSVQRVLVIFVLSTCVVCAVLALRFRPPGFRPGGRTIREISTISAAIGLYLISGQVLVNIDLWSLKILWQGGGEVIGHYVASMNLAKTLMVIPAAQSGVLFASVAWALASQETMRAQRHIHEATRFALIIAAAAWVILGLDASEILSALYSNAYADGQRFLRLQLAGFGFFALIDAFAHALMAAGGQRYAAGALIATIPLAWCSNILLIPWLGPLGAAISMVLGTAIGAAVTGGMVYRRFGSLVQSSTVVRVFVAAAVVGLVSVVIEVHGLLVIVKLSLLGGLYLLVLYLTGEITGKDFGLPGKKPIDPST
jgi:O-antigen/teichoic acid export membrane protein